MTYIPCFFVGINLYLWKYKFIVACGMGLRDSINKNIWVRAKGFDPCWVDSNMEVEDTRGESPKLGVVGGRLCGNGGGIRGRWWFSVDVLAASSDAPATIRSSEGEFLLRHNYCNCDGNKLVAFFLLNELFDFGELTLKMNEGGRWARKWN